MNPLTNVKNITKLNEIELAKGLTNKKSWHDMYKDSAWIFIGGLAYGLTEGDILAVFSQFGEVVNVNLVRDKKTGKTKGFCFLCYANQKSTVLAVDNFNGIKLCNRTIRVDHVSNYKPPKEDDKDDEITKMLKSEGCAPKLIKTEETSIIDSKSEKKKHKKHKKEKKHKKKRKKHQSDENDSENEVSMTKKVKVKKEKLDPGYDKYDLINETSSSVRMQSPRRDSKCFGEGSGFQADIKTEVDNYHGEKALSGISKHRTNSMDKDRFMLKAKRDKSIRKKNMDSKNRESSRSVSPSDSSSSSSEDNIRSRNESVKFKNNQKHRNSSNQSSSSDERHRDIPKEKYQSYHKSSSHQKEKDKYDHKREDSYDNISGVRSSHHARMNNHSDHKSKSMHRNKESHDKYSRDSHYSKSKYEK